MFKIVTMAGPKARLSAAEWRGGDPVPVGEVWYIPSPTRKRSLLTMSDALPYLTYGQILVGFLPG